MIARYEILFSTCLGEGWGRLTEYRICHHRMDGSVAEIDREIYDRGGHAACVLPHDPVRDTVLLVRQLRLPAIINGDGPNLLEACAGALDGDLPESGAVRETLEEIGVVVHSLRHVTTAYASPSALLQKVWLYIGNYSEPSSVPPFGGIDDEETEVIEMPLSEAFGRIGSGDIIDMKTIILLQVLMLDRIAAPCTSD